MMRKKNWDEFWKEYRAPSKAEIWLIECRNRIIINSLKHIQTKDKIKILEVGCGFASNSRILKKDGRFKVFCVDSSKEIISKIKKDIPHSYVGNAENMSLFKNNSLDIVFSSGLIEHFKQPASIIREMHRVLKKGGLLITFVPGKYSLWQVYKLMHGKNWQHGYEESYTQNKLKLLVKDKFKSLEKGGLDPFSLNGVLLKVFNFKLPFTKSLPNAYTEIYSIEEKI